MSRPQALLSGAHNTLFKEKKSVFDSDADRNTMNSPKQSNEVEKADHCSMDPDGELQLVNAEYS